jgi:hypothetical protein
MKQDVETGSVATIYKPSFIKTGSGIQKFMGGGGRRILPHTHRMEIA